MHLLALGPSSLQLCSTRPQVMPSDMMSYGGQKRNDEDHKATLMNDAAMTKGHVNANRTATAATTTTIIYNLTRQTIFVNASKQPVLLPGIVTTSGTFFALYYFCSCYHYQIFLILNSCYCTRLPLLLFLLCPPAEAPPCWMPRKFLGCPSDE